MHTPVGSRHIMGSGVKSHFSSKSSMSATPIHNPSANPRPIKLNGLPMAASELKDADIEADEKLSPEDELAASN